MFYSKTPWTRSKPKDPARLKDFGTTDSKQLGTSILPSDPLIITNGFVKKSREALLTWRQLSGSPVLRCSDLRVILRISSKLPTIHHRSLEHVPPPSERVLYR